MKAKHFLIGAVVLNVILIFMLIAQQIQIDAQLAAWPDNRQLKYDLIECQQMNLNATRLLKDKIMTVKIK